MPPLRPLLLLLLLLLLPIPPNEGAERGKEGGVAAGPSSTEPTPFALGEGAALGMRRPLAPEKFTLGLLPPTLLSTRPPPPPPRLSMASKEVCRCSCTVDAEDGGEVCRALLVTRLPPAAVETEADAALSPAALNVGIHDGAAVEMLPPCTAWSSHCRCDDGEEESAASASSSSVASSLAESTGVRSITSPLRKCTRGAGSCAAFAQPRRPESTWACSGWHWIELGRS